MRHPVKQEIGVSLLGLGNVGTGVIKLLADNAQAIEDRLGAKVVVRSIAVRDLAKQRSVDVGVAEVTDDVVAAIDRDDVQIVCELVGGEQVAREFVLRAIAHGKHVVTANKALLAVHGNEIFAAAEANHVDVYYEAAVCAGVPIVRALREGLASDRIEQIWAIVNGTSNYILSRMAKEGAAYDVVLRDAQAAGYAEADPTLDVGGVDAAHKLSILAMLCFGTYVPIHKMAVEGIEQLDAVDFEYAERFGYVIKPLVVAREHDDGVEARVHPTMIPREWLLAAVDGAKNALYVKSYALGPSMYYGAGAGMMPTAVACVSDLIEVARNLQAGVTGGLPLRSYRRMPDRPLRDPGLSLSRFYLRFGVQDRPGVLGQLATILGRHSISIAQVVQEAPGAEGLPVRIVVLTHEAQQQAVDAALAEISTVEAVVEPAHVVRIAE